MTQRPSWMNDPPTEDQMKDHMQRFYKPDGRCLQCREPAGAITIKISERDMDNGKFFTHEFCSWECLAHRFAGQAGGVFVATWTNSAAPGHNE